MKQWQSPYGNSTILVFNRFILNWIIYGAKFIRFGTPVVEGVSEGTVS